MILTGSFKEQSPFGGNYGKCYVLRPAALSQVLKVVVFVSQLEDGVLVVLFLWFCLLAQ